VCRSDIKYAALEQLDRVACDNSAHVVLHQNNYIQLSLCAVSLKLKLKLKLKLTLIYDRQSVGQSVLVSGAHLGPLTNISVSLKFPSDSCVFVIL
jgi:hypothetical protein